MILNAGDRLLVAHRRLFADDQPRFFIAVVDAYESGVVMASGYSWVRDAFTGGYQRNGDRRTKVFSLVSGSVIVYRLPRHSFDAEQARGRAGGRPRTGRAGSQRIRDGPHGAPPARRLTPSCRAREGSSGPRYSEIGQSHRLPPRAPVAGRPLEDAGTALTAA